MTESSRLPVEPGEILAGKYRVDRVIGSGAMGVVVAAHHVHLDDEVAIKFMLPEAINNAQAVERFSREARAVVKIKSDHVVRVLDVGMLENGTPYMVMEYLRGKDLAEWLTERGSVLIEQAIDFLLQAAEAIAEAHSLGIVHRDLKPANLFVIQRGDGSLHVKVLDFGISKVTGQKLLSEMTQTSVVMGSPFYMSPEQLRSTRDVDLRSDIWALGVILYELIAGGPPFEGDTMPELVHRTVSEPPLPLRDVRPDAPEGLEAVILKCLEKDPAMRFQNVAELAEALVPYGPERAHLLLERISGFARLGAATMPSTPATSPSLAPRPSGRGRTPTPIRSSSPSVVDVQAPTQAPPSDNPGIRAETAASWAHTQERSKRRTALSLAAAGIALVAVTWFAVRGVVEPSSEGAPASPAVPQEAPPSRPPEPVVAPVPPPPVAPVAVRPDPSAAPRAAERVNHGKRTKRAPAAAALPAAPGPPVAPAAPSAPAPALAPTPKKPSFSDLIDDRK